MTARPRHVAHLHLHQVRDDEQYAAVLDLVTGFTPHVQAFPPDAVQLDLTSALRYFGRDPYELVQLVNMRLAAWFGVTTSAGLARNRMLAAMAASCAAPGRTVHIRGGQDAVDSWLYPQPVTALPGVGRATAETLHKYGLHTVGQVAGTPAATLQRLLGAGPARLLADRARGHDPRPVTPLGRPAHMTADRVLTHDCLDPAEHHRTVLDLAEQLGHRLRTGEQITGALALTVRYADRTATTRTRTLAEPTAHSPALIEAALGLLRSLGLQRARVRAYSLRSDRLLPAGRARRQLSLDPAADRAHAAESAGDRARRRFGPDAVRPATLATGPDATRQPARPASTPRGADGPATPPG